MSADAAADAEADAADADAAAERRLNHSIPRTYFVRGIQLRPELMQMQSESCVFTNIDVIMRTC